jgi:hypothetical protein
MHLRRLPTPVMAGVLAVTVAGLTLAGFTLVAAGDGTSVYPATIDRTVLSAANAELEVGDDGATLVANRLPPPPAGEEYMVWIVPQGSSRPEPTTALFTPGGDGSATVAIHGDLDGVEAVLVNTEPLDGHPTAPTTAPILTASLS